MTSTRDLVRDERDKFAFHDDIVYLRETKRGQQAGRATPDNYHMLRHSFLDVTSAVGPVAERPRADGPQ